MRRCPDFVNEPAREFEFFLAEQLGQLHAEMVDRMSNAEFVAWQMYYGRKAQRAELDAARARRR